MERHQYLLSEYQQIFLLSQQMLALAMEENWDALVNVEVIYINAVARTTDVTISSCSSPSLQQQLKEKLQSILDIEIEIRHLLQQRLDTLSTLIVQSTRQQRVNNTYNQLFDY